MKSSGTSDFLAGNGYLLLNIEYFAKKRSLMVEAAQADAVRPAAAMCSLEYPEVTVSSIARTAATALTTSACAVLKGYKKKGNALASAKT